MTARNSTSLLLSVSLTIGVLLLVATSRLSAGETIVDNERGFRLTLPDGFEPNSSVVNAAPNIIHAFVLGDPNDDQLDIFLMIEKMRGTIGPERLRAGHLPPGFQGKNFTAPWQAFEVEGFEVPEKLGDVETVTYNVQIPLQRAAIQVKLFGARDREAELRRLLTEILAGLKGDSNWLASAFPRLSAHFGENYGLVLLVFAIVLVLGGLVMLFVISKWSPEGTVLVIAVSIYIASWLIGGTRVREVILLSGAIRMLGFAGIILGIIDIVRRRRRRSRDANQGASSPSDSP